MAPGSVAGAAVVDAAVGRGARAAVLALLAHAIAAVVHVLGADARGEGLVLLPPERALGVVVVGVGVAVAVVDVVVASPPMRPVKIGPRMGIDGIGMGKLMREGSRSRREFSTRVRLMRW